MKHVVIVGAGLFGSIAAALAHRSGFRVTLIDRGEPRAGSGPAACLMKPGWFSGISNKDVEAGFALLGALYEVKTIPFRLNGVANVPVYWVDPKTILTPHHHITRLKGSVGALSERSVGLSDGGIIDFDACLLAAGVWTPELHPVPMKALAGAAFTFDKPCTEPFIKVWAPYKQLVGFEREPGKTWVGDGSAILDKNWTAEREDQSLVRCIKALGSDDAQHPFVAQTGLRPYVEGHKAGFYQRRSDRVWVSTGGAKNGTIIAAIQAKRFVDDITHFL